MNRKKLFIHIGTHKTGTTLIQRTLQNNFNILKSDGIRYLRTPIQLIKLMNISSVDSKLVSKSKKELNSLINSYDKRGVKSYVLSFEGLSGDSVNGYRNVKYVAESLKKITEGYDVKIIVYLRRQDYFIESLYTQMIKQGESYSFDSFVKSFSENDFNYENLLNIYSKYFGKKELIVKRYDKIYLPERNSLIKDFAKIIEFNKQLKSKKNTYINKSYSMDALEIARLLNPELNNKQKVQLRKILQQADSEKSYNKSTYWLQKDRRNFLNNYNESNKNVANHYFNDESGILFHENDHPDEQPVYKGISIETAIKVFGVAILSQSNLITDSIILRGILKVENKIKQLFKKINFLKY